MSWKLFLGRFALRIVQVLKKRKLIQSHEKQDGYFIRWIINTEKVLGTHFKLNQVATGKSRGIASAAGICSCGDAHSRDCSCMPPPPESTSDTNFDNPDDSEETGNVINNKGKTGSRESSTNLVNFVQYTAGISDGAMKPKFNG